MIDTRPLITTTIAAPRSWGDADLHLSMATESAWYQMLTRLYAVLLEATNQFYAGTSVAPALMPLTVSSVSSPMGLGSDSLPVRITLAGEKVYLADSMQFQLEFLLRHGLEGAYYVMPSFRGEPADRTHLNQFFHSEAEILGGLDDVIDLVERYLMAMTRQVLSHPVHEQVAAAAGDLLHVQALLSRSTLPRVTFDQAQELLGEEFFELRAPGAPVITRRGEVELINRYGGAVWLTHPPHRSVPFYQRRTEDGRAECADLLLGVGEVVGCGARHITGDEVRAALHDHQVDPDKYRWYLEMKDNHPLATAGFGLGLERYVLWLLNHDDIRDLHVMPRIQGLPICL